MRNGGIIKESSGRFQEQSLQGRPGLKHRAGMGEEERLMITQHPVRGLILVQSGSSEDGGENPILTSDN